MDLAGAVSARLCGRPERVSASRPVRAIVLVLSPLGAKTEAKRQVATLDRFHGYKNAVDDKLADATSVLDALHVVKLGSQAVHEVRRRIQQAIHGHRGRRDDSLYRIRNLLRCADERLTKGSGLASPQRLKPTSATSRCSWPGSTPKSCGRSGSPANVACFAEDDSEQTLGAARTISARHWVNCVRLATGAAATTSLRLVVASLRLANAGDARALEQLAVPAHRRVNFRPALIEHHAEVVARRDEPAGHR